MHPPIYNAKDILPNTIEWRVSKETRHSLYNNSFYRIFTLLHRLDDRHDVGRVYHAVAVHVGFLVTVGHLLDNGHDVRRVDCAVTVHVGRIAYPQFVSVGWRKTNFFIKDKIFHRDILGVDDVAAG